MTQDDLAKLVAGFLFSLATELARRWVSQRREQRGNDTSQPQSNDLLEKLTQLETELAQLQARDRQGRTQRGGYYEPSAG